MDCRRPRGKQLGAAQRLLVHEAAKGGSAPLRRRPGTLGRPDSKTSRCPGKPALGRTPVAGAGFCRLKPQCRGCGGAIRTLPCCLRVRFKSWIRHVPDNGMLLRRFDALLSRSPVKSDIEPMSLKFVRISSVAKRLDRRSRSPSECSMTPGRAKLLPNPDVDTSRAALR